MDLVRGNPTEVKVVLASVATALAVYQLVPAAVFYVPVAITIVAVTAQLGPTSAAELEAQEERQEERLEQQEDRGD